MIDLLAFALEQAPRLAYLAFSGFAVVQLAVGWTLSRVMTQDKRFLLLFFALEIGTTVLSGVLKMTAGTPVDSASWATVLCQGFLCAYLHYATPRQFRTLRRRSRPPGAGQL